MARLKDKQESTATTKTKEMDTETKWDDCRAR